MAVNSYECLLIFDSNRYSRDQAGVSGQIAKFIENAGGQILVSRLWEERRLAYPIEGHRKGTYWLTYFRLDSLQVRAIERECQLSESILRALVLKVDPRVADALVSHALGAPASQIVRTRPAPAEPAVPLEAAAEVAAAE